MLFEKLIVAIKYDSMRKIVFEVYVLITEEQSIAYFHFFFYMGMSISFGSKELKRRKMIWIILFEPTSPHVRQTEGVGLETSWL